MFLMILIKSQNPYLRSVCTTILWLQMLEFPFIIMCVTGKENAIRVWCSAPNLKSHNAFCWKNNGGWQGQLENKGKITQNYRNTSWKWCWQILVTQLWISQGWLFIDAVNQIPRTLLFIYLFFKIYFKDLFMDSSCKKHEHARKLPSRKLSVTCKKVTCTLR